MSLLRLADGGLQMSGAATDLSIPLQFDGPQPNHFGATPAHTEPMRSNDFVGDTRQGGSCNAASVTLNPHCNGTHTECVGHLTTTRVSINDVCPALPLLAALVSVEPSWVKFEQSKVRAITAADLHSAVEDMMRHSKELTNSVPTALIIRTLPNAQEKTTKVYKNMNDAVFMQVDAVDWLVSKGIDHLLVDLPSIDPYSDHGKLAAHRALFGLPSHTDCPNPELTDATRAHATLTEMIYVTDDVIDGLYLLNLQIPPFCLDAAPSRPIVYSLEPA